MLGSKRIPSPHVHYHQLPIPQFCREHFFGDIKKSLCRSRFKKVSEFIRQTKNQLVHFVAQTICELTELDFGAAVRAYLYEIQ